MTPRIRAELLAELGLFFWRNLATGQPPKRDYSKEKARPSPAWVREGVIYEIFPRAFSPAGNFRGISARLDQLNKLGVSILWLMPIHPVGELKRKGALGSPYSIRDYYAINQAYGTADDLKELVRETHRHGMKIIIDMVANHTSWDSVMMKHPEFYRKDSSGKIISPDPGWDDVAGLDYGNPALRTYMTDMLRYWLQEFDLDGFRCDVAGLVPTDFWESARAELERVKPGFFLLAEWHEPDLMTKAFDADYAWPLHRMLTEVLLKGEPAKLLRVVWEEEKQTFPQGALHMRFSDNHDERRAIARFGEGGALAASAFMFGLDGIPMIYNGMEVGDTTESGGPALFEKLPVFWPIVERRPQFARFYQEMIALRRSHPALHSGATIWLDNSNDTNVTTWLRQAESEEILVAVNFSGRPLTGTVEVAHGAEFSDITPGREPGVATAAALPALHLDAWGFRLFRRAAK